MHFVNSFIVAGQFRLLPQLGNPFDVVFMDCMMPVLDGPSAAKEMKSIGRYKQPFHSCLAVLRNISRCSRHSFNRSTDIASVQTMAGYLGKIVGFTDVDPERAAAFVAAGVTTLLDKPILPPVVAKLMQSEFRGSTVKPFIYARK